MTLKTTVKQKTTNRGKIATLSESRIFLDLREDELISSFEARKRIKKIAISAPPTPIETTVVIEIALETALVLDEVVVTMVESMLP